MLARSFIEPRFAVTPSNSFTVTSRRVEPHDIRVAHALVIKCILAVMACRVFRLNLEELGVRLVFRINVAQISVSVAVTVFTLNRVAF